MGREAKIQQGSRKKRDNGNDLTPDPSPIFGRGASRGGRVGIHRETVTVVRPVTVFGYGEDRGI
jgi:hypothetical protein